jgi:tight adherence protein B
MAGHEIGDPIGSEFRPIEAGMRLGRDLESLLWEVGKRIDAPEFRFFVIGLSVQRETGRNLAERLSNLADVLRRRRTMRAKAPVMASEARQHENPRSGPRHRAWCRARRRSRARSRTAWPRLSSS